MKNVIFVISVALLTLLSGCAKKDSCDTIIDAAPDSEVEALHQYILNNKIEATQDPKGFFYKIQTEGNGNKPNSCSSVRVNYRGTLTNGTVFDEKTDSDFNLSGVIKGWKVGIPHIGESGKITLYLPPSLGYGSKGIGPIPGNAILIFSIDLVKVY